MSKKVLVTGVGGPAAVAFMRALTDPDVELHAADIDPYAPGLYLVPPKQRHLILRGGHPWYVSQLLALCAEHQIDAVVPTVDAELQPLSRAADSFAKRQIRLLVASPETLQVTLDKWQLVQLCAPHVPVPKTALCNPQLRWESPFPCIIKPRTGSGSRGVQLIEDSAGLAACPRNGTLLVQEFLPGEEFSVDVYVGVDGQVHAAVPRLRLKVDSGVAITSRTLSDSVLIEQACAVAQAIGLRGVANIQFRRDHWGTPRLLEVNPRFAGTMSLTVHSGVNIPQMALDELYGRVLAPGMRPFQELGMVRTYLERYVTPQEIQTMEVRAAQAEQRYVQSLVALPAPTSSPAPPGCAAATP